MSLATVGYLILTALKRDPIKRQVKLLLLTSAITFLSGIILMLVGGSIARSCVMLSTYAIIILVALWSGNQLRHGISLFSHSKSWLHKK